MKNMEVLEKMELGIPYTSDGTYKNRIDGVKKIYKKREKKYKKIEELIDKETEEMEINPIRKEQSIITMNEANVKLYLFQYMILLNIIEIVHFMFVLLVMININK